jgi:hypothetical protein
MSIEDAIPVIQLSRKKKDKRVFGVLGAPTRNTNNILFLGFIEKEKRKRKKVQGRSGRSGSKIQNSQE